MASWNMGANAGASMVNFKRELRPGAVEMVNPNGNPFADTVIVDQFDLFAHEPIRVADHPTAPLPQWADSAIQPYKGWDARPLPYFGPEYNQDTFGL
eukprot:NODE_1719_length_500_cov_275.498891_g1641_i0.p1 GENE.NODE_1719_length_500_cov_275.498891_g1641_i0~~NODE_1719_length_500_cov_275.498891_g1641_i0.p1  ORF type:complete len:97 (-),score=16.84 NODE_1719_length_500_cov_275.498891_g1641_i0:155-445(-)